MLLCALASMAQNAQQGKERLKVSGNAFRRYVPCSEFFKTGENGMVYDKPNKADTLLVLPHNFPTPPIQATTCGCYKGDFMAFYLSPQKPNEIFTYYSKKLQEQGYIVPGLEATQYPDDFLLRFKNSEGAGYIYVYGDRYAYKIFYEAVGRSCNCPIKR